MADHSITIAVATTVLGLSPPTTWNSANWGSFNWGYTTDFVTDVTKGISESETADSAVGLGVDHGIEESQSSDSSVAVEYAKYLDATITLSDALPAFTLQDGAGYFYVFPDRTTDGEERDFPTWTSGSVTSVAWTSGTVTTTTWS